MIESVHGCVTFRLSVLSSAMDDVEMPDAPSEGEISLRCISIWTNPIIEGGIASFARLSRPGKPGKLSIHTFSNRALPLLLDPGISPFSLI